MADLEAAAKAAYEAMQDAIAARSGGGYRPNVTYWEWQLPSVQDDWRAAVEAAVTAERERCAKIAECHAVTTGTRPEVLGWFATGNVHRVADAIRKG